MSGQLGGQQKGHFRSFCCRKAVKMAYIQRRQRERKLCPLSSRLAWGGMPMANRFSSAGLGIPLLTSLPQHPLGTLRKFQFFERFLSMLGMNRTAIPPAANPAAQKFLLLASLSQTSCKYLVACLYSIIINTLFGFSSARQYFFRRTKQAPEYAEQHTAFQDTICQRIAGNTDNVWKS